MIKISTIRQKESINIIIKGHAKYADFGKDIVCASCSSIVITTINAIEKLDKATINYCYSNESLKIEVKNTNKVIVLLVNNMLDLLKELEKEYPKNIKIL